VTLLFLPGQVFREPHEAGMIDPVA